jgi:LexA DNA binding domain
MKWSANACFVQAVTIKSSKYGRKDGMPTQLTDALGVEETRWKKERPTSNNGSVTYFGDWLAQLSFTRLQGQYLAFIAAYTKINGLAPAEADMQRYFRVTAPSVHQMVVNLERLGLISRQPSKARSIQVLVPVEQLPALD